MKYTLPVLSVMLCLCALFAPNTAKTIKGPRWIYRRGAARYTCPNPFGETIRKVKWRLGRQTIFRNNIANGRSQVYDLGKHEPDLQVDGAASQGLDLVLRNVSRATNRKKLSCAVSSGSPHYATVSYSTLLNVTHEERPLVYVDSMSKQMAAITCLVPDWEDFHALYVNDEKIVGADLQSLEPAGGVTVPVNLTSYARRDGEVKLNVFCSNYNNNANHFFHASPNLDGSYTIRDTSAYSQSHADKLTGSTLVLATVTLLLRASRLPDSML